jgi:hypothetical protein
LQYRVSSTALVLRHCGLRGIVFRPPVSHHRAGIAAAHADGLPGLLVDVMAFVRELIEKNR